MKFILYSFVIIYTILMFITTGFGLIDSGLNRCPHKIRVDYIIPGRFVGCWLGEDVK